MVVVPVVPVVPVARMVAFVPVPILIAVAIAATVFTMVIDRVPVTPVVIMTVQIDTEHQAAHQAERIAEIIVRLSRRYHHQGCGQNGAEK